jgi:ADP-heptose:LPS heptosyltransferase
MQVLAWMTGVISRITSIAIPFGHAINLGFMLAKDELECVYVPDEFTPIKDLPEKYVVLHVTTNWPNRTWAYENWIELIVTLK